MRPQDFQSYKQQVLQNVKKIVVKVGSAVLTTENDLDLKVITRLADDLSLVHNKGIDIVVVSSGAVAAGCNVVSKCKIKSNLVYKQAASAIGQSRLMHIYDEAFARFSKITAQILLTREDLKSRERFLNARNTFSQLFEWRTIPIVNENDTVAVQELKFGDNDQLAVLILNLVEADLLINLTSAQGVFEKNPSLYPKAKKIDYIENIFSLDLNNLCEGKSEQGSGGMYSKLLSAKRAAQLGVPTVILPGKERFILEKLFSGQNIGSWILPEGKKISRRKFWFAYNLDPEGQIIVDEGAEKALQKGKSLLPVGIMEVRGSFSKGALVQILSEKDTSIGVGLTNYNSSEIKQIKGKKSSELTSILGENIYSAVIHADNLLLDVFLG
ncbi:glutamate 5-kinase [Desulfonauticus submarinus]